jgi:hypothetical protein
LKQGLDNSICNIFCQYSNPKNWQTVSALAGSQVAEALPIGAYPVIETPSDQPQRQIGLVDTKPWSIAVKNMFLEKIACKEAVVGIVGMGYVGFRHAFAMTQTFNAQHRAMVVKFYPDHGAVRHQCPERAAHPGLELRSHLYLERGLDGAKQRVAFALVENQVISRHPHIHDVRPVFWNFHRRCSDDQPRRNRR